MSWAWPSRRSSTEKLSNQVMIPWSLTPFTRNMVTGVLVRLRLFRNMSCRLLTFSGIALSFWSFWRRAAPPYYHAAASRATMLFAQPSFASVATRVGEAQCLQFAVERGPLHADEIGRARDVAREAADLDPQIFTLERLARFPERRAHDRLDRLVRSQLGLIVEQFGRQHVDLDAADPFARRQDDGPLDHVPELAHVAGPI